MEMPLDGHSIGIQLNYGGGTRTHIRPALTPSSVAGDASPLRNFGVYPDLHVYLFDTP